ncbi:PEP-CTERM sorting domain-containing protein [Hymenobacter volaticus]
MGIAVEPAVLTMTVIGIGLMSYWLWRRRKKR